MSLLELNFLPTSGSSLTKQQLILAREYMWQCYFTFILSFTWLLTSHNSVCILFQVMSLKLEPYGVSSKKISHPLRDIWLSWNVTTLITSNVDFLIFTGTGIVLSLRLSNVILHLLSRDELPEAAYMHQLLGLNLLFLLSQNRVSEFHTELERLSARDIQTNVYIRHPVSLEQVLHFTLKYCKTVRLMLHYSVWHACLTIIFFILQWPLQYLMEGSYNKVFLAKGNIPAESYTFFIDILLDTIR